VHLLWCGQDLLNDVEEEGELSADARSSHPNLRPFGLASSHASSMINPLMNLTF
jgi:hypothetical protein